MSKNFATQNNRTGLFSLGFVFFLLFLPTLSAVTTDGYNYSITKADGFKTETYTSNEGYFSIKSPEQIVISRFDRTAVSYLEVENRVKDFRNDYVKNLFKESKIYGKIHQKAILNYSIYSWSIGHQSFNHTGWQTIFNETVDANFSKKRTGTQQWIIQEGNQTYLGWIPFEKSEGLPLGKTRFKIIIHIPAGSENILGPIGSFNTFWRFDYPGNTKNNYFSSDPGVVNSNSSWEKEITLNGTVQAFGEVSYFYNYTNTTDSFWNLTAANAQNFRMLYLNSTGSWIQVGIWNVSFVNTSYFAFFFRAPTINGTYRMSLWNLTTASAFDIGTLHSNTSYSTCNDEFSGANLNSSKWTAQGGTTSNGTADGFSIMWFSNAGGFGPKVVCVSPSINATLFFRASMDASGSNEGMGLAENNWPGADATSAQFYGDAPTQSNGFVSGTTTNTTTNFGSDYPTLNYFRVTELAGRQNAFYVNNLDERLANRWYPTNTQNTQHRQPTFWTYGAGANASVDWLVYSPSYQNVTSVESNQDTAGVVAATTIAFVSPTPANGSTMNQTFWFINVTTTGMGSPVTCNATVNSVNTSLTVAGADCSGNFTTRPVLLNVFNVTANGTGVANTTIPLRQLYLPILRVRGFDQSNGNTLAINHSITDGTNTVAFTTANLDRWFWRDLTDTVTGNSINITGSASGYGSETVAAELNRTENSADINQSLIYLIPNTATTLFVRIHVVDSLGRGIQSAAVTINRTLNGTSTTVEEGVTDASGIFSDTFEQSAAYAIRGQTASCDSDWQTIVISTVDYYITCGTATPLNIFGAATRNVQWRFAPDSTGLTSNTTLNFTAYNFTNETFMNFTCFSVAYSNGTSLSYQESNNSNGSRFSYRVNANAFTSGDRITATGCFRGNSTSTISNYSKNYTFFFGSPPGPYVFNLGAAVGTLYYSLGSIAYTMLAAITAIFSAAWVRKFTPSGQASFLVAGVIMGIFLVAIPVTGAAFGVGVLLLGGLGAAGLYYMFKGR